MERPSTPSLTSISSTLDGLGNQSILHAGMLRDQLNRMIEVSRLKDLSVAGLFAGL